MLVPGPVRVGRVWFTLFAFSSVQRNAWWWTLVKRLEDFGKVSNVHRLQPRRPQLLRPSSWEASLVKWLLVWGTEVGMLGLCGLVDGVRKWECGSGGRRWERGEDMRDVFT